MIFHYDYPLFRPPSEAESLIFQVTYGCSHNQCLFCSMYKSKKYFIKPIERVLLEITTAAESAANAVRVFLADGDAFALETQHLLKILQALSLNFPKLRRISAYASAQNILRKSEQELTALKQAGLDLIYLGLESGDALTLKQMAKGSTPKENIEAVIRAKNAGITVSVMVILGLGGRARSSEHAIATAQAVSQMDPPYLSALTLMLPKDAPLYTQMAAGKFELINSNEVLQEMKILIEQIEGTKIVFRTSHASNYLNLRGTLPRDKDRLVRQIDEALLSKTVRPDYLRGL